MNAIVQFRKDASPVEATSLSAAMAACPESLAVIESGRVLYSNQAFARMFGYFNPGELQGRELAEFVPEVCHSSLRGAGTVAGEVRSGHSDHEFSSTRQDGSRIYIETSCTGFQANGRHLLVLSARDISQRKQAERQLQEAQRMEAIGRLVSGVAHDFNNLLTGIMLYCDLLIAGLGDNHHLRRHADEIRMAGEQGAGLVRQLLAVARHQAVEPRRLAWNEVVVGMRNLLDRLIGEDVELVTLLPEGLGCVRMDQAQMQQIILNLVLNARDAMPQGGRVTLAARNCNGPLKAPSQSKARSIPCVELTVTDNGCGIDAQARSHLFEPFFTSKGPGRGTGLGLVTVHRIVKQAGGTIEVESEPGKGTRVRICLPRTDEHLCPKCKNKKKR
jgi:PAS domain S-box-containing protein